MAVLVPFILVLGSMYLFVERLDRELRFTREELQGVHYITRLQFLAADLQRVRGLRQLVLVQGHAGMAYRVDVVRDALDQRLDGLVDDPLSRHFMTRGELVALRERLRTHRLREDGRISPRSDRGFYSERIEDVRGMVRLVAHRSGLVLDPDYSTYYLMTLTVDHLPALVERMARLRGEMIEALGPGSLPEPVTERVHERIEDAEGGLVEVRGRFDYLERGDGRLHREMRALREELVRTVYRYAGWNRAVLTHERTRQALDPVAYFERASRSVSATYGLLGRLREWQLSELRQRLEVLGDRRFWGVTGTLLALLLMLAGFTFFYWKNRQALARLEAYGRQMERASITDALTGVYNRRYGDLILERELRRAHRAGAPFAFALFDIDHFKHYNDHHGHQAGDDVLCRVADTARDTLRRGNDFLFRFGGEEFCFCLPEVSCREAQDVAEGLHQRIEGLRIVNDPRWEEPFVTISIGLLCVEQVTNETPESVLAAADEALYAAKKRGRNRVSVRTVAPAGESTR